MSNTVEVDVSIAGKVSFKNIGAGEIVNIKFTADVDLTGSFMLTIWNSAVKNSEVAAERELVYADRVLTWDLDPEGQSIKAGTHYYEIFSTQAQRIIFKSFVTIEK